MGAAEWPHAWARSRSTRTRYREEYSQTQRVYSFPSPQFENRDVCLFQVMQSPQGLQKVLRSHKCLVWLNSIKCVTYSSGKCPHISPICIILSTYTLKEYLPRSLWWIAPCPKQRPRRAACHLAHSPDLGLDPIVTIVRAASTSTRSTRRSKVAIVARAPLMSITRVAMSRVAAVTREAPPRADADVDRSRRRVRTSSRAAGSSTRWRRVLSTTSALALLFAVAARAQAVRWVRARLKFKRDEISF